MLFRQVKKASIDSDSVMYSSTKMISIPELATTFLIDLLEMRIFIP